MHQSGSTIWRRFVALFLSVALVGHSAASTAAPASGSNPLDKIENIIVIYLENWSFDGLFGKFPGCNNLDTADAKAKMIQTDKSGRPYDVLPADPQGVMAGHTYPNGAWDIEPLVKEREGSLHPVRWLSITHRYYHEIYQINGGKMDRFVAWSSANGLTMSYYDVTNQYFGQLAQNYTLLDNFYHSAFGGSMLNHQWLVAAATPVYPESAMEPGWKEELVANFTDGFLSYDGPVTPDFYAVNHMESRNPPLNPSTPPSHRIPSQNHTTVGDLLSNAGVSWRWYSGGYDNASIGIGMNQYQFHHQPFVFFDRFKDPNSWDRREHLKDEVDLLNDLATGNLPRVSFYKPYGADNFHPGSSTVSEGQRKLQIMVEAVQKSKYWNRSAIVITFDENGGRWDHVTPPVGDKWGPGSRVPAVIVSPFVRKGYVDSTQLETISITKFIEELGGVKGTVIPKTRNVTSLAKVFLDAAAANDETHTEPIAQKEHPIPTSLIVLSVVVAAMLVVVLGFVIFLLIRGNRLDVEAGKQESLASKARRDFSRRSTAYGRVDEEVLE